MNILHLSPTTHMKTPVLVRFLPIKDKGYIEKTEEFLSLCLRAVMALRRGKSNSMIAMIRRAANCLCVVGICALHMHSAQNGNYARKELLKDIGLWSLVGCLSSYLLCTYIIFRKMK